MDQVHPVLEYIELAVNDVLMVDPNELPDPADSLKPDDFDCPGFIPELPDQPLVDHLPLHDAPFDPQLTLLTDTTETRSMNGPRRDAEFLFEEFPFRRANPFEIFDRAGKEFGTGRHKWTDLFETKVGKSVYRYDPG